MSEELQNCGTAELPNLGPKERWGDLRVPYVALWSSEMERYVSYDSRLGEPALFTHGERGEGRPVFGKMNEARQRRAVLSMRCQVCCEPLQPPFLALDRHDGQYEARPVGAGTFYTPLLSEPFVCPICALYSLSFCPGLARYRAEGRLRCYVVHKYDRVKCYVKDCGSEEYPQLEQVLRDYGRPVVSFVKLGLTEWDTLPEVEFVSHAKARF